MCSTIDPLFDSGNIRCANFLCATFVMSVKFMSLNRSHEIRKSSVVSSHNDFQLFGITHKYMSALCSETNFHFPFVHSLFVKDVE